MISIVAPIAQGSLVAGAGYLTKSIDPESPRRVWTLRTE